MKTFLISRTDAIGDVVLTLPLCGWIKEMCPGAQVIFLGRTYTEPVVACCQHVDRFINADELLKLPEGQQVKILQDLQVEVLVHVYPHKQIALLGQKAKIPVRVGTRNRWFHWLTCNRLPGLSRRNSLLHESQLNLQLLQGMGFPPPPSLSALPDYYGFNLLPALPAHFQGMLRESQGLNIILHPKSKGSAREWQLPNFGALAGALHQAGHRVFITGSAHEREFLLPWLKEHSQAVTDLTGQLSLAEFISFISASDGLVAASTGPLHLASAAGVQAVGLYPPLKPVHPGRWAPLGRNATFLVKQKDCQACRSSPSACQCINEISVAEVLQVIYKWKKITT
jgi:heptosyltransferase III